MKSNNTIATDYLVIGSGAMSMAFAVVLVSETDATALPDIAKLEQLLALEG
jgi:hypothetical protein